MKAHETHVLEHRPAVPFPEMTLEQAKEDEAWNVFTISRKDGNLSTVMNVTAEIVLNKEVEEQEVVKGTSFASLFFERVRTDCEELEAILRLKMQDFLDNE